MKINEIVSEANNISQGLKQMWGGAKQIGGGAAQAGAGVAQAVAPRTTQALGGITQAIQAGAQDQGGAWKSMAAAPTKVTKQVMLRDPSGRNITYTQDGGQWYDQQKRVVTDQGLMTRIQQELASQQQRLGGAPGTAAPATPETPVATPAAPAVPAAPTQATQPVDRTQVPAYLRKQTGELPTRGAPTTPATQQAPAASAAMVQPPAEPVAVPPGQRLKVTMPQTSNVPGAVYYKNEAGAWTNEMGKAIAGEKSVNYLENLANSAGRMEPLQPATPPQQPQQPQQHQGKRRR
jgi:hypothetical protein